MESLAETRPAIGGTVDAREIDDTRPAGGPTSPATPAPPIAPSVAPSPPQLTPSQPKSGARLLALSLGGAATVAAIVIGAIVLGRTGRRAKGSPGAGASSIAAQAAKAGKCAPDMAEIPGGTFMRASGGEVTVAPFCMDKTEVTIGAYDECVKSGACRAPSPTVAYPDLDDKEDGWRSAFCPHAKLAEDRELPVSCLDWDLAQTYCAWKGRQLPTAAEFEWAARGGKAGTKYPWGDEAPGQAHMCSSLVGDARGWREDDGPWAAWVASSPDGAGACRVGSHPKGANPWGVQDLLGNVWEWVSSERDGARVYLAAGSGWNTGNAEYVHAGGLWESEWTPESRSSDTGFRCVGEAQH
jgi:formylglycine-generating enzyme required for sulfatase activity